MHGSIPMIQPDQRVRILRNQARPQNGVMLFLDAWGRDAGRIEFKNAHAASPCFTPGTMIATQRGEVAVERLDVGDRIITRDNGLQVIRWLGKRAVHTDFLPANAHLCPVRIARGALGNDLPEREMVVSPNHRILVSNDKTALHFDAAEVLVSAKHLTGLPGVERVKGITTHYLHLMFERHEVILSDGVWSESFRPDVRTVVGIGNAQRIELLELFPELATKEGLEGYAPARHSLTSREAALIK
jgi:hypothetical protein